MTSEAWDYGKRREHVQWDCITPPKTYVSVTLQGCRRMNGRAVEPTKDRRRKERSLGWVGGLKPQRQATEPKVAGLEAPTIPTSRERDV